MSKDKKTDVGDKISLIIGIAIFLAIAGAFLNVIFGGFFKATPGMNIDTATVQDKLSDVLYANFDEFGRLEVRLDYSMHAYIPRTNYMKVPYPDRDESIRNVGKIWCGSRRVPHYFLPKFFINDIQTGKELGKYGCVTGWVSKE
jgi:hypothetical protein